MLPEDFIACFLSPYISTHLLENSYNIYAQYILDGDSLVLVKPHETSPLKWRFKIFKSEVFVLKKAPADLVPGSWCKWWGPPWSPPPQLLSDTLGYLYTHELSYAPRTQHRHNHKQMRACIQALNKGWYWWLETSLLWEQNSMCGWTFFRRCWGCLCGVFVCVWCLCMCMCWCVYGLVMYVLWLWEAALSKNEASDETWWAWSRAQCDSNYGAAIKHSTHTHTRQAGTYHILTHTQIHTKPATHTNTHPELWQREVIWSQWLDLAAFETPLQTCSKLSSSFLCTAI